MRKLFITCLAMCAMLAVTASSAAAAVTVQDGMTGVECSSVSVSGNTVSGGCLVDDVAGTVTINWGSYPQNCQAEFDLRIAHSGAFYASDPKIHSCSGSGYPSLYKECENASGVGNPWAGSLKEGASSITATMTMCHSLNAYPNQNHTAPNVPFDVTLHENNNIAELIQTGPGVQTIGGFTFYYKNFANGVFANEDSSEVLVQTE